MKNQMGFTLIEVMLILVLVGAFLLGSMNYQSQKQREVNVNDTAMKMQQILNAAMVYYVANGSWPPAPNDSIACLQGDTTIKSTCNQYLPVNFYNKLGSGFKMYATSGGKFVVKADVTSTTNADSSALASVLAGKLPLSYTLGVGTDVYCQPGMACEVYTMVDIPGQNLNNATAVNFAGLYHQGACVPVPFCPKDVYGNQMAPQIIVVPVQISGVNDDNSDNVYPISSFTGYATGPNSAPVNGNVIQPPGCTGGEDGAVPCGVTAENENNKFSERYWRVCVQVITEKGNVQSTRTDFAWFSTYAKGWGGSVTVAAFTRCSVTGEASGSNFTIFGN